MTSNLFTKYLDKSEYENWDRFVDESRHGSIYNQSYFLEALCNALGTQFRILAVFKNKELAGGVGLHYSSNSYGDMVQLRPLLYYNGLVIKDFESNYPSVTESRQAEVINTILNELEGGKYASAELSNGSQFNDSRTFIWRGWKLWPRYTYVVPIQDLNHQWDKVDQNLRRLISRCEREGISIELSDDADAFYTQYEATYQRKGVETYIPREKFLILYQALKQRNACQIYFAVTSNEKRAAGLLVLMSKHPVTHSWMASSDPAYLRTGASAFLRWKAFEDLNQRGYAFNDLTDAMNEKVAKFKSQLGGDLKPSFVIYKEISSKLRLRNRIKNLMMQPVHRIQSMFKRRPKNDDNSSIE